MDEELPKSASPIVAQSEVNDKNDTENYNEDQIDQNIDD